MLMTVLVWPSVNWVVPGAIQSGVRSSGRHIGRELRYKASGQSDFAEQHSTAVTPSQIFLPAVAWSMLADGAGAQEVVAAAQEAHPDAGGLGALPWLGIAAVLAVIAAAVTAGEGTGDGVVDKTEVTDYFNSVGFSRWSRIYSESENINFVQQDIRDGHAETVNKILGWLNSQVKGKSVCDAGCGTGSLSIPLAARGAHVSGSDISSAMASEAERRAKETLTADVPMPEFKTSDLEALDGSYDCVCCVDVLIHYPPQRLQQMVTHLASLSNDRVILSFAPKTWYYQLLKRIGELFPGPAKTTRAYLHDEALVEDALAKAGFKVTRRDLTATSFYFSRLLEARK